MAKLGSFPCPKCDRRFKMAAHLARHMSVHGIGASKTRGPWKWRRAIEATSAAIGGTVHDLVDSLRTARDQIVQERAQLSSQIEAIGKALVALGHRSDAPTTEPKTGSRRRAKRGTVIVAILRTLQAKGPIKPADLARIAGAKPTTVSTALDNLRKKKLALRSDSGWSLTASGRAELAKRQKAGS